MNKAMFSSKVLGRICPWVLLPFMIFAIPCSQLYHSTLFLWSFNLHPSAYLFLYLYLLYRCNSLDSGPILLIPSVKTLFLYQFIFRYRGVRSSCIFGVGHNSTFNRWYPDYSLIQFFSRYHEHTSPYMAMHSIFYSYFQIEGREAEQNEETNSK